MRSKSDYPSLNERIPDGIKPGGKPYKVMVVESKDFQRKLIAQILESEQYEIVATAADGSEALKKYDHVGQDLDLITTDLDMPNLDGYALLYELRQKKCKAMVVFVSEETTKGVMKDLISMGIADFIVKPINRRVLLQRIKNALLKATNLKEEGVL